MVDYLEIKVKNHCFFQNKRTDINFTSDLGNGVFTIPLLLKLKEGDKLHFSQVDIENIKDGKNNIITHDNYTDVEITRKDEKNYFLKLDAKDMLLLGTIKKFY